MPFAKKKGSRLHATESKPAATQQLQVIPREVKKTAALEKACIQEGEERGGTTRLILI